MRFWALGLCLRGATGSDDGIFGVIRAGEGRIGGIMLDRRGAKMIGLYLYIQNRVKHRGGSDMRTTGKLHRAMGAIVAIVCIFSAAASAGWNEKAKINSADASEYDYFGTSVAVCGDYAIVGARYDDDHGMNSGSAYIFKRTGEYWTQYDKLTASDASARQNFGWSVSMTADYAIVGALGDGSKPGAAYVFKRGGGGWGQVAKLTASDGVGGDKFGVSVAICSGPLSSGDYALVGAYWDDDKGVDSGSVYVFDAPGGMWIDGQEFYKLLAPDGAAQDYFGYSVAMSGDYAAVGAPGNDDNGGQTGSAYVFKRNGTSWSEQAKLLGADSAGGDWLGYSVAICPYYCIVGASSHHAAAAQSGAAYIFRDISGSWSELSKLTASDGEEMDLFGCSVSIDSDWAVVGAYLEDFGASETGSAYVYEHTCPTADLSGDCRVEYNDVTVLGDWWLEAGCGPLSECPPDLDGSGRVDFGDLVVLASQWLAYN